MIMYIISMCVINIMREESDFFLYFVVFFRAIYIRQNANNEVPILCGECIIKLTTEPNNAILGE